MRAPRWVVCTLVGVLLGALGGLAYWTAQPRSWNATASVVLTGADGPDGAALYVLNGLAQNAVPVVAAVAESDLVTDEVARSLNLPRSSLRGSVSARPLPGTVVVEILVSRPDRAGLTDITNGVTRATVEQATQLQGPVTTRVEQASAASLPRDGHRQSLGFILVIWLVLGGVLGAVVGVLLRPSTRVERATGWDLDARIAAELARWTLAARQRRVQALAAGALVLIVAHAATGSSAPVLLLGLILAGMALRDLRWAAVGSLLLGLGATDPRITLVPLGFVTVSVQDLLLGVGVAGVVAQWWVRPPELVPTPLRLFAGPLIAFGLAVVLGAGTGYLRGAGATDLAEPIRVMVILPLAFVIFRRAYAGRAAQLLLTVLACSFVSSSLVLLAVPLGWTPLLSDVRDYVVTGVAEASVTRLANPVLVVWSVLLVVLAAGVARGTSRPLWLVAALPGVAHVALSFNRSTWVPLVVMVLLAAGLRAGLPGLLRRGVVVVVVGTVGLALAVSGALGAQVDQVGTRALSAVTGEAVAEDSLTDRLNEDQAAVATLEEQPWVGTGIGRPYGGTSITFDAARGTTVVTDRPFIHNQYLRVWLLLGVAGLVSLAWLVVRVADAAVRLTRTVGTTAAAVPLAAALGLFCTGLQGVFQTNLIDRPTMLASGLCLALITLCVEDVSGERRPTTLLERTMAR